MKVTILGCGGSAGVPHVGGADGGGDWGACDPDEPRNRRTRSAIVIEGPTGERLLIDTPPDLRAQLLACRIGRVEAVLFTHSHADHITGLDEVRMLNRVVNRPIDTYATPVTLDDLRQRFDYAFRPWKPPGFFRPVLVPHEVIPGDRIATCGMELVLFHQDHRVVETLGLRVGGFAYSTDVVALDETAFAALQGIDTWLVGCFQRTPHSTHAHLDLVLSWSRRLKVRRTILTHMGIDLDWNWLKGHLPTGVEPAQDGQTLDLT